MEPPEVLPTRDGDRETSHVSIAIWTNALVQARYDTETQKSMLHVLGQPARYCVIREMTGHRDMPITIPEASQQQGKTRSVEFKNDFRKVLRL
jgi:hypothetical protein